MEHLYVFDFALRHQAWFSDELGYAGWRAGLDDDLNFLTAVPDAVGDWLWQKPPWVTIAIDFGLAKARADWRRGQVASAAAKLALACHYVADLFAVSHAWLDVIGDASDCDCSETYRAFHDPVEVPSADYVTEAVLRVPARPDDPADYLHAGMLDTYRLGRQLFDAFFAGRPVEPLVLAGVRGSAAACWVMLDAVTRDTPIGSSTAELARAEREWVMAPLFDLPAAELVDTCRDEESVGRLKSRLGYENGDIFCRLDRCTPEAKQAALTWRADRRRWREQDMAGVLPPAPESTITADWRPESDARFSAS